MWDKGWDNIFINNEWSKYPDGEIIRFIAGNYYNVPDRKLVKILEVGSGTGANVWYLASEGFDVIGIDGSRVGIERMQERLRKESFRAAAVVGDIVNLPFVDKCFDCVIDNECIYANSYKDSKKIIAGIYRVLKPQGKFFSKTFMTGTYGDNKGKKLEGEENTYEEIYEGALRQGYGIIRFTSEKEIEELYGCFKIESIDYLIRSNKNRKYEIKEWILILSKEDN